MLKKIGNTPLVLIFLVWSLWLAVPYLAFGTLAYVRIHDNGDSNLPSRIGYFYQGAEMAKSYWLSYMASGTDRLAQGDFGLVEGWLFRIFPGWLALGSVMFLQRFVAGYFTARLALDSLRISKLPAVSAGLFFSLFSMLYLNRHWDGFTLLDGFALPGLPLVLWALSSFHKRYPEFVFLLLSFATGYLWSVNSGIYFTMFLIPYILFWFVFVSPRRDMRALRLFSSFLLGWVTGEIPLIWASLMNAPLSQRSDVLDSVPGPVALWDNFWVYFNSGKARFLGIIRDTWVSLTLVVLGYLWSEKVTLPLKSNSILVVSLFFYMLFAILFYRVLDLIFPFLSGINWRLDEVLPFVIIISGALGLKHIPDNWRLKLVRGETSEKSWNVAATLAVLAILAAVVQSVSTNRQILHEMQRKSKYADLYEKSQLRDLASELSKERLFRVASVSDPEPSRRKFQPGYAWAYGLETADGYVGLYSNRYRKYWNEVIGPLTERDGKRFDFHGKGTKIYLFLPRDYSEGDAVVFADNFNLPLLSLANVEYIISSVPVADERLTNIHHDLEGAARSWYSQGLLGKIRIMFAGGYPSEPIYLYRNSLAFPRFRFLSGVRKFESEQELAAALQQAGHEDLARYAYVLTAEIDGKNADEIAAGDYEIKVARYERDRIVLQTRTSAPMILAVANSYSPYWSLSIDEVPADIFPLNIAFQGVRVPAGRHTLKFSYSPPYSSGLLDPLLGKISGRVRP